MRFLKALGKFFLAIISFVLCVALFASALVTMLVADVKVATNKDNLQNLLNQTLSAPQQQPSLRPINLAAGADIDLGSIDFSSGISDYIVEYAFDSIQEMVGEDVPLDLEQIKEFVEESTIEEFISEKSSSIISDIYTGNSTTTITSDEIVGLIEENKDLIKEHFDVEIPVEQLEEIKTVIDEIPVIQQIQEEGITSVIMGNTGAYPETTPDNDSGAIPQIKDTWYGQLPGFGAYIESTGNTGIYNNPINLYLEIVRYYTSDTMLWLCIGVCAVLIGLLFLCAWNKPYKAMIKSGITLFLAGGIFLTPTLIAWLAVTTWTELFSFQPIVGTVARFILMLTGGVCGSVAGIGLALIVGGIVVCVLMKKKKAALAAAAEEPAALEEAPAEETPAEETAEEAPAEEAAEEADEVAEEAAEEVPVEEAVEEVAEEVAEEAPSEEAPAEETV